jgi:aconitase B
VPFKSTRILVIYVALLVGCTSSNQSSIPEADFYIQENSPFGLRVGDTVGIVARSAIDLVRFNLVQEDSRCPVDVECPQAGAAVILLTVQTALNVQELQLDMPPDGEVTLEVQELTLVFTRLTPPAMDGVEIEQLQYQLIGRGFQSRDLNLP